ncbi:MAG: hypothetical protein HQ481_02355 [Alphaproteobacteria bacterium]|nr:hypothetical protein [Alphaproteobacteria bacterium]
MADSFSVEVGVRLGNTHSSAFQPLTMGKSLLADILSVFRTLALTCVNWSKFSNYVSFVSLVERWWLNLSERGFRLTTSFVGVTVLSLSLVLLYLFASAFYQPLPNDFVGRSTPPADQETTGGAATVSAE